MSRIGRRILKIPDNVMVNIQANTVKIQGPKGTLEKTFTNKVTPVVEANQLIVKIQKDSNELRMHQGTVNSILENMIQGVTVGFVKELQIFGVGYNVKKIGSNLELALGFSHKVVMPIPKGIEVSLEKQTQLKISGIDKQKVGEFAAQLRALRPPEPYGGKGIRYKGEVIRLKAGKKAQK